MDRTPGSKDRSLSPRVAATAFGIYVAIALPAVVFGLGRYFWFLGDDWDFLTDRQAGSIHDLLRPHAEHLSTLPILVTRAEWHVFGFHYWRYQFVVMTFHLTAAVLLRIVLRRAGVSPWVASAAAAGFVLFSPGYENLLWSFQLAWVMTLCFGLLQLIAADQPESTITRRDVWGLLAGLGALLCSGIAPVLIGVAGLMALLRRGWRVAAFHTIPLGILFGGWYLATRSDQPKPPDRLTPASLARWLYHGYRGLFEGLGAGQFLGIVFLALMVVGIGLAWGPLLHQRRWDDLRQVAAIPASMALGGLFFQILTARGRLAFGYSGASAARYLHVGAVLIIPMIAVGADAIATRWRRSLPVVVALLLVPIPGNIRGFDASGTVFSEQYFDRQRTFIEAVAWSPLAERVPRSSHPVRDWLGGEGPPVGWLLDARRADKIHRPKPSPEVLDEVEIRLGIRQTYAKTEGSYPRLRCHQYRKPIDLQPEVGDQFRIQSRVGVRLTEPRAPMFLASIFDPLEGTELEIALPDLQLRLTPVAPGTTFKLCR